MSSMIFVDLPNKYEDNKNKFNSNEEIIFQKPATLEYINISDDKLFTYKSEKEEITKEIDGFNNSLENNIDCYYTKLEILKYIAKKVKPYINNDVTFVDFACGKNEFAPLLKCKYISFDIVPYPGVTVQDWLTVDNLPNRLIIGLNPPFGYQGNLARQFILHALTFKPLYLFLILPNMKWTPNNYEAIYNEQLPNDSFYNPSTNKVYKEISTTFWIYKRNLQNSTILTTTTIIPTTNSSNPKIKLPPNIQITRKWMPKQFPYIALRRVGRNTTKQFYCAISSEIEGCCYIEKGEVYYGVSWSSNKIKHAVESDYFLKIYFKWELSMEDMIKLCNLIYTHPEEGYDRKQPHAITNRYVAGMILKWLEKSNELTL